jgi:hypothetical protein
MNLRPLTSSQEKRAKHPRADAQGYCTRCGMAARGAYLHCPPGFWMNKHESKAWSQGVRYEEK